MSMQRALERAVRAEATAVSGETRYTCPSRVPERPRKFRLKVLRETPPEFGEKLMLMQGPQAKLLGHRDCLTQKIGAAGLIVPTLCVGTPPGTLRVPQ